MIEKILDKSKLISLEEESHTYTLLNSNIHFQSVTEFIHTFFKPFEEKKVAAKLTEKHPKYIGMSIEELIKNWNERRDRGTLVHKQIENFILEKKNKINPKFPVRFKTSRIFKSSYPQIFRILRSSDIQITKSSDS